MDQKDKEVEEELKIMDERERANTGRLGITVRNVAKNVIKANAGYYYDALLQLIPKEILDTELTDDNLARMTEKIYCIRFKRDEELSALFQGVTSDGKKQTLEEIINSDGKGLNKRQLNKITEIKFLNDIALTIIRQ